MPGSKRFQVNLFVVSVSALFNLFFALTVACWSGVSIPTWLCFVRRTALRVWLLAAPLQYRNVFFL
jgi:hypothetical protein